MTGRMNPRLRKQLETGHNYIAGALEMLRGKEVVSGIVLPEFDPSNHIHGFGSRGEYGFINLGLNLNEMRKLNQLSEVSHIALDVGLYDSRALEAVGGASRIGNILELEKFRVPGMLISFDGKPYVAEIDTENKLVQSQRDLVVAIQDDKNPAYGSSN